MARAGNGWPLLWALAAAQVVSWGSVFYSFSLFVVPMEAELGWSRAAINGALTLPANIARALAPLAAALIWAAGGGYDAVLWSVIAAACAGALAFWYASIRRH